LELTIRLTFGQPTLFNAMAIPLNPLDITDFQEPIGCHGGKTVEGKAHRFSYAHQAVDCSDFG
jgi:hypothetical protein